MKPIPPEKIAEARRLRIEENKSTPRIARALGICNFSVYAILRDLGPWNPGLGRELSRTQWTLAERSTLRRLYPSLASQEEICGALPGRAWYSIQKKASSLGMKRPVRRSYPANVPQVVKDLRREREAQRLTRPQLAKRIGCHYGNLRSWELGRNMPVWLHLTEWAQALGFEIVLQKRAVTRAPVTRAPDSHVRDGTFSMFRR